MCTRGLLLAALVAVAVAGCGGGEVSQPGAGRPPVVILILDEFPTDILLGPDGRIDSARFPNFAALASSSTWFPNGHTIYDSTFKAVPSILDARLPRKGTAADVRSHHGSVYTLFDRLGYGVVDVESGTALCPPRICPGARTRRPGVLARLRGNGRRARLRGWIGAIGDRGRPTLYVQHALLPHEPWIYLPSGRQNRPPGEDPIGGINRPIGFHDPALTRHNHGRLLLQVGFVDHELGLLLRRLRRTGQYEDALVAVLADHGYSFQVGVKDRRLVTDTNVEEIAPVPFFLKAPGQHEGKVDRSLVRTIDLVPTIAELLEARIGWRHDGHSAFAAETRARRELRLPSRDFSELITITAADLERRRRAVRLRRARTFETGAESALLFGDPWAAVYRVGPRPDLLGRRVGDLDVRARAAVRADLANAELPQRVSSADQILPTRVTGKIRGGAAADLRDLAVAVNGRVRATGRSFRLRTRRSEYFSLLVPESSLEPGANRIQLFELDPAGGLRALYDSASP